MPNQHHDCCLPSKTDASRKSTGNSALPAPKYEEGSKRTVWASIGLGILASACCWLPLALAGLGVATGTLGAKIAWIRPWALGGLLILLLGMLGWWARKYFATAETTGNCCAVAPKFPTLAVMILGGSFVLAWASPGLLHPRRDTTLTVLAPLAPTGGTLLVLSTPQFDCPPCVGTMPQTMTATPGVVSVQMDFDKREAHIVFQPDAAVDAIMAGWKKDLGFDGKEIQRVAAPSSHPGPAFVQGQ